jgi:hypothetical protein
MAFSTLLSTYNTQAGIRKIESAECTQFSLDNDIQRGERGAEIVSDKISNGIITKEIKIDFDNRRVLFHLDSAIIMGFNKRLTKDKVYISSEHEGIDELVDMHRKDLFALTSVCISKDGEILDFTTNIED